jgi:hypothetical protein
VKFGEAFGGEALGESRRSGRHDHHEIRVDVVGISNELVDDLDESASDRGLCDLVEAVEDEDPWPRAQPRLQECGRDLVVTPLGDLVGYPSGETYLGRCRDSSARSARLIRKGHLGLRGGEEPILARALPVSRAT